MDFETLKEDVDDELDDFPIVLDSNIKPNETQMNRTLTEAIIQRGKNQELLENIIVDGEIEDQKNEQLNATELEAQ